MSAERKFQIINERPIDTLSEEMRERWLRIIERQQKLAEAEARLKKTVTRFHRDIEKMSEYEDGEREAYRGFRVDDEGIVWRRYCECPACQASLQGMTVSVTVEEMIRQNLIDPAEIPAVRKRAAELDAEKRVEEKKQQLQN